MAGVGSHRNERTAEDILHVERLLAAGHVVVGVAEPIDAAVVDQTGQKVEDYCLAHECSKAN